MATRFTRETSPVDLQIEFFVRGARSDTTEAVRQYALRRLSFPLRRFRPRVRYVTVRLVDENGPRRGVDSRCSVTLDLVDGRQLFVEATAAWPFAAITLAVRKLGETLRRDADRHAAHGAGTAGTSQHKLEPHGGIS
jgi:putative sigma-54 modulation protein